jgi:C4-dicarboxylate transporter, DcuC family
MTNSSVATKWGWALVLAIPLVLLSALGARPDSSVSSAAVPSSRTAIAVAVLDLVFVTALVTRGFEVRMVLLLGAFPLFAVMGRLPAMVAKLVGEMANAGTVVPICSAMGFAFVLRFTECDQHLVRLLVRPLQKVRALLIPGGILAGYLINTTIVSQAGTAAVLGPILIPVLRAGGLGAVSAGAILLLGSSMGGELFNPGAVEMRKLTELTGVSGAQVIARSAWLNLMACAVVATTFCLLAPRRDRRPLSDDTEDAPPSDGPVVLDPFRVDLLKAMVPILPLLILAVDALIGPNDVTRPIEGPPKILAAMLIGVVAAGATRCREAGGVSASFFEGAGYAYSHVISLIVAASTFAEAIRISGLIELMIATILPWPAIAKVVATVAPWALAFVSGTGIAPAVSIMEFFVPVASTMGIDPVRLGTLTALGAHFGRTMSPAAAVVMMAARLSETKASDLIKRVFVPLLAGGAVLLAAALLGFL